MWKWSKIDGLLATGLLAISFYVDLLYRAPIHPPPLSGIERQLTRRLRGGSGVADRVTEYAEGPRDRFRNLKPGRLEYWRTEGRRLFFRETVEQSSLSLDAVEPDRKRAEEWAENNSRSYGNFCRELQAIYSASIGVRVDRHAATLKAAARSGIPDRIALALTAESA